MTGVDWTSHTEKLKSRVTCYKEAACAMLPEIGKCDELQVLEKDMSKTVLAVFAVLSCSMRTHWHEIDTLSILQIS
jgi:hypothetical protein